MALPKKKEKRDESEDWLTTYADAITLLLCFFVTLTAISRINVPIFEEMQAGIASELGRRDVRSPIALLEQTVQQVLSDIQISSEDVIVDTDDQGVFVEFPSNQLFEPGTARLSQNAAQALDEIAVSMLAQNWRTYVVEVQAHTNSTPPGGQYRSNWDLSTVRAAQVVKMFERQGIAGNRLKAVGWADGNPKMPEDAEMAAEAKKQQAAAAITAGAGAGDGEGAPVAVVMPDNDRVVLRIHPPIDPETGAVVSPFQP